MTAKRPAETIGIAGAGRAGAAVAAALADRNESVLLWGRNESVVKSAARRAGCRRTTSLRRLVSGCDLLLVAVSDRNVEDFARHADAVWPGGEGPRSVLHLAGSLPAGALQALRHRGVALGVFHPVVALGGTRSRNAFGGAVATISGDHPAQKDARRMARLLGMSPVLVDDEKRPLIHLAAMLAAGDLTALLGVADDLLSHSGIDAPGRRKLLRALSLAAVHAFVERGPADAMTGPVPRGDVATMASHAAALNSPGVPEHTKRAVRDVHAALVRVAIDQLSGHGRLSRAAVRRLSRAVKTLH